MQIEGETAMIKARLLVLGLLGAVLFQASAAKAQENGFMRHEVAVQGTGFFTKDSNQNGTLQHSTNTGGFLVNYRFHINGWLAAEAGYGYDRNTQQDFTPGGDFGVRANTHQATGALVVKDCKAQVTVTGKLLVYAKKAADLAAKKAEIARKKAELAEKKKAAADAKAEARKAAAEAKKQAHGRR